MRVNSLETRVSSERFALVHVPLLVANRGVRHGICYVFHRV